VPGETIKVSKVTHPTQWARAMPFHDNKVWGWGGRFNDFKKNTHVEQTYLGHF
jgi:hypothetical protein